ncbi:lipocalin-like domain-containing protein [Mycobacterium camsae]|uniref:lipocalin-like domain-containing protein n=1 Tax=Mycobacterium gordonae TaxID=1778 RepID=UPI00197D159A|nr:lipocalin-like domain-containing protein [Mycobacterium gordonae]
MKKLSVLLVAALIVATTWWWWAQPQGTGTPPRSFLGLLSDEDQTGYATATQPGAISFPRDLGAHEEYQHEWWYYTANLSTADGRRFGVELTFFRRALTPPLKTATAAGTSLWRADSVYSAHFAVSDISGGKFHPFEKFSRGAAGLAGARAQPYAVWLEDWYVHESENNSLEIHAKADNIAVDLTLQQTLPPIKQGIDGLSLKGDQAGNATYYYSMVRQQTQGKLTIGDDKYAVNGLSWHDHEYGTSALDPDDIGWDWFSLQFDDGTALMLFQILKTDGRVKPTSSGSFISRDGTITRLKIADWRLTTKDRWTSPRSGKTYPIAWELEIDQLGLKMSGSALMPDQELPLSTTYWEGAVAFGGRRGDQSVEGRGYVEMTGAAGSRR